MKIRIDKVPPGSFAPLFIREQWVGVEMEILEDKEKGSYLWDAQDNAGGFVVGIEDAIKALRTANKEEAAAFWEGVRHEVKTLRFKKDCCTVV